ncbi:hypothetical protein NIES2104_13620 [Leptolyngbya sp. NIES-2104]|nr:hypothetical protein NIES2104_13620 [Leptolyngbya sp. NIES-2104]
MIRIYLNDAVNPQLDFHTIRIRLWSVLKLFWFDSNDTRLMQYFQPLLSLRNTVSQVSSL